MIRRIAIAKSTVQTLVGLRLKSGATIFSIGLFLLGCTPSFYIPTIEESEQKIVEITPRLDSIKNEISTCISSLPEGNDIVTRIRVSTINSMLKTYARASKNYLNCEFLPKEAFISDEDSILGVYYKRYINIDSGSVDLDLKTFQITTISNDTLQTNITVKDTGSIKATFVDNTFKTNVQPRFEFFLDEQLRFSFSILDSKKILLCPVPKIIMLKTKFYSRFLRRTILHNIEIPIETLHFFRPITVPAPLQSEMVFFLPAVSYGEQQPKQMMRSLTFIYPSISANNNIIEYKSNISISKP